MSKINVDFDLVADTINYQSNLNDCALFMQMNKEGNEFYLGDIISISQYSDSEVEIVFMGYGKRRTVMEIKERNFDTVILYENYKSITIPHNSGIFSYVITWYHITW